MMMTASERQQHEYLQIIEENKKQKKKIDKLTAQIEKDYNERKELANKQIQDVKIKFDLEAKVNRLKSKVKNLKMEIKEDSLSGNSIGDNKCTLLEINLKTDNNFNCVEDIISFILELQKSKSSNSKRQDIKYKKCASEIADELRENSLDMIDKYKSENQKLKDKIKEKNKEIDNFMVDLEIAKTYQEKLKKSNIREKEKDKKLEQCENKIESCSDEIRAKDKKISDLENKINSITEDASSNNKTVDKIRDENKSLKKEKLEKDKIIETLKKEKQDLIEVHKKEMTKKQNALEAIRSKLDNVVCENTDLTNKLEILRRENQSIIENNNTELEEKTKDLVLSKSQIQNLESKVNELKALCRPQKVEIESKEKSIEKINTKTESTWRPILSKVKKKIAPAPPGARGNILSCPNCQTEYFVNDLEKHLEECIADS